MTGVRWCGELVSEMAGVTLEQAIANARALVDHYMADPRAGEAHMNASTGLMYLRAEHDRRHGVRERNERAIAEVLMATLS